MKITLLGTGSSQGVPQIGCQCAVCTSSNPKNKRSRVSAYVEVEGKALLIDTSPDFRTQALANNIPKIDAILYTHAHADHILGLDDLRPYNQMTDAALPVHSDKATLDYLSTMFAYAFKPKPKVWFRPALIAKEIPADLSSFECEGIKVTPVLQQHGDTTSLGFRIGNFAYSTDMNGLSEESFKKLENLDVWVVDCLRDTPSYTHAKLSMTLEWVERLKPKRTIFTHMAHEFEYEKLKTELPAGVEPGYDGLVINL